MRPTLYDPSYVCHHSLIKLDFSVILFRFISPSNPDVTISRWGVSRSQLDNVTGVLRHQNQHPPHKTNPRWRKAVNTHRSLWFSIASRSNHGSGNSGGGHSCHSCPNGVTTSYRLNNIAKISPSGGGSSRVHGSTTRGALVFFSIYTSKYFCSFSLYLIRFIIVFDDSFILMVYFVYFVSFFAHETILFLCCECCYINYSYSRLYFLLKSFSYHNNIVFSSSHITIYNQCFFLSLISRLKCKYFCKIFHDSFTIVCTCFLFIH